MSYQIVIALFFIFIIMFDEEIQIDSYLLNHDIDEQAIEEIKELEEDNDDLYGDYGKE